MNLNRDFFVCVTCQQVRVTPREGSVILCVGCKESLVKENINDEYLATRCYAGGRRQLPDTRAADPDRPLH